MTAIVVIGEIGKMACFAALFGKIARSFLDGDKKTVAPIALHGGGFIADVEARGDMRRKRVKGENGDRPLSEMTGRLV